MAALQAGIAGCDDPEDYATAYDVCPGPMRCPHAVWCHLMAGITALARRACRASLADAALLTVSIGGPLLEPTAPRLNLPPPGDLADLLRLVRRLAGCPVSPRDDCTDDSGDTEVSDDDLAEAEAALEAL